MKFCPECGKKHESEICTCGFNFKEYESKKENKENNFLFSEPGMREMNDPYKNNDYRDIYKDFETAKKKLTSDLEIKNAKKMGLNNLSDEEIKKILNEKHFTA